MAQYNDLYLRCSLTDQGSVPRQGAQDHSPDVIPCGLQPVPNAERFFRDNYGQEVGREVVTGGVNYIYVRAKNLGTSAASGVVTLYWSERELLNWSTYWEPNKLKTSTGADSAKLSDVAPGEIAVTRDPFLWTPHKPAAAYTLIARIATERHPDPIPTPSLDFTAWCANNGGSGAANVTLNNVDSPQASMTYDYDQSFGGAMTMAFVIQCINCFADGQSYIAFSTGTPAADGSIVELVKVPITSDNFIRGTEAPIQDGWRARFAIDLWDKALKPGLSIRLFSVPVPDQRNVTAMNPFGEFTFTEAQAGEVAK